MSRARLGCIALWLLMALVGPPAAADQPPPAAAIRDVITRQLEAFRQDDAAAAFAHASPAIQRLFETPDRFMAIVRDGYRPVYRPRAVEFQDLVTERDRLVQRVLLVGPDGAVVIAHYAMELQPDGRWLIDGCVLEEHGSAI